MDNRADYEKVLVDIEKEFDIKVDYLTDVDINKNNNGPTIIKPLFCIYDKCQFKDDDLFHERVKAIAINSYIRFNIDSRFYFDNHEFFIELKDDRILFCGSIVTLYAFIFVLKSLKSS